MFIVWIIGWIFTGEYDHREYGFWKAIGLCFYWPQRLAEILKEKGIM